MSLSPFWEDRLKTLYDKYNESERIPIFNIINQFACDEVYDPKVSEHDIFKHLYNKQNSHDAEITAKRQPNPFMVFRTALGMTAAHKNVKLGDGTCQSRTAGLLWRGAKPNEKKNFENLSSLFKDLHKQMFPTYEYKPRQRNPIAGTFVDMSNNNFVTGSNNQSIPQQSHIHQQIQSIPKDNNVTILDQLSSLEYPTTEFDPVFMNLGGMPYQPEIYVHQQPYLPEEFYQTNLLNNVNMLNKVEYPQQIPPPSIAENCPNQYDINNGSFFLDNNNTFTNTNYYPYFYYQQ